MFLTKYKRKNSQIALVNRLEEHYISLKERALMDETEEITYGDLRI